MNQEHIVSSFDDELKQLNSMVLEMGGLAESQLAGAVTALSHRDVSLAKLIVQKDFRIDDIELEIHKFTLRLLATRQPKAVDLRAILAALKISSALERIGDYSKNIAKRTTTIAGSSGVEGISRSIVRMSSVVQSMITNILDAYVARDLQMANDITARDEEVDHMHTDLFQELLTCMTRDPHNITMATHLLFISKNVERIGDHVTSIAEQVHFMVAGDLPNQLRPKGVDAAYIKVESENEAPN